MNKLNREWSLALAGMLFAFLAVSVHGEETPVAAEAEKSVEDEYTYKGEKSRDPFVPLVGQGAWDVSVARTGADAEEFNPAGVELKGILQTKNTRLAVLRTPSGISYLVKNGKIQDARRKIVEGYVGIVKEKSLVLIGPNNQVTELKLKKDQEIKTP